MKIAVRYFAHLRERLRRESDSIELADGSTVGDLLLLLGEREPLVAASRRSLQVAVNMEFMPAKTQLKDGDEVALIPPVAGGSALVRLSRQPLQYDEVIAAVSGPGQGGIVLFAGLVRDHNDGKQVVRLDYEAYDEMAVRKMAEIAARIESEQPGVRVAMVHRVGSLQIGDLAVILAASAPHRGEAFAACRAAIEALKVEVPIWKKEFSPDGEEWLGQGG
ncbi:MAG TPA: molybdopterin converting factor subunit 1 [Pseudomonadota bacterium]|nr:molybdopterin converting factor subunit 1 [Pseudomonadota bacterium]HNK44256.1 molybdopterin converting factor subunit 1 [Pseudomonadota bacterium]HNN49762.1 molybdopterin converting factor subunit 1 [Pseudomonadota bacterium]